MYAIVRTGGKQYRVEKGDIVELERLPAAVGATVTLEEVLAVGDEGETRVGAPRVENARVIATVLEQGRGPKIRVFKYKRRKHYRRTRGHRQSSTRVRIERVEA